MRSGLGETLLLIAAWIEALAVRVGGPVVAASFLASHRPPPYGPLAGGFRAYRNLAKSPKTPS